MRQVLILFPAILIPATIVNAQFAPPVGGGNTSRAVQLPLSGRTGASGAVTTIQTPLPGGTTSVNTINSSVQVQGSYQGSVTTGTPSVTPLQLSLDEGVRRGLQYNLGTVGFEHAIRQARGERYVALSQLLPNVSAGLQGTEQQTNLAALGFKFRSPVPGFNIPTVVGPFHYFDLRARLTQTVADLTTLRNYRASAENVKANELSAQDARDLVVLAVTASYLQIIAASARVDSARVQVATAQATYRQAVDRHDAGLSARIDVTRSQVELQIEQQRLTSQETDLARQKIILDRLIGLPAGQDLALTDAMPFGPLANLTLDQALDRAYRNRADLKAAEAQVRAADLVRKAAVAERYPSVEFNADYGVIGPQPTNSHGTFSVTGALRVPIFQGGRVRGDIEQADAALDQRRAEYQDLRGRIDADVRNAFLDLTAAASQVGVAQSNRELAQDTLRQARDRFAAGVADTIEVIQAQQSVAGADLDYISSLYAHNLAKASLARALGMADQGIKEFLGRR